MDMNLWNKILKRAIAPAACLIPYFGCGQERLNIEDIVCNPPYIRHGNDCCLDQNGNNLCDVDENFGDGITDNEARSNGKDCVNQLYFDKRMRNLEFIQKWCNQICDEDYSNSSLEDCKNGVYDGVSSLGIVPNNPNDVGIECVNQIHEEGDDVEETKDICTRFCMRSYDDHRDSIDCFFGVIEATDKLLPKYIDNVIFTSGEIENISYIEGRPDLREAFLFPGSQIKFCYDTNVNKIEIIGGTGGPCNILLGGLRVTGEVNDNYEDLKGGRVFIISPCIDDLVRTVEIDPSLAPNGIRCFGLDYHDHGPVLAIDAIVGSSRD